MTLTVLLNGKVHEGYIPFPDTEVGKFSEITLSVRNDLIHPVTLIPYSMTPEVSVEQYPQRLEAGQEGVVKVRWTPSANNLSPLNAKWGFRRIIG